jgi:hypothetical protein
MRHDSPTRRGHLVRETEVRRLAAPRPRHGVVRAARRLNRASGMLALSVLADSAIEHYRGRFENRAMYTPLVVSTISILASLHGTADRGRGAHRARDASYLLAGAAGLAGLGFHLYNVGKRPGGYRTMNNFFYAAPIGAPGALALSGLLGFASERVRDNRPGASPTVLGLPAGKALALLTSAGLAGTVSEVGLLHFRGAFHNPAMYIPVTMPPVAAGLLAGSAALPGRQGRRLARLWLRLTAFMGFAGVAFHSYGVARQMGGWRNWSQNVIDGPPLPAPPSFTGLALAGLAALWLLDDQASEGDHG